MLASIKLCGVLGAVVVIAGGIVACSSSSSDNTSGGTTSEAGAETSTPTAEAGADAADAAAAVVVNSCNTFIDRSATGASRDEAWGFPIASAPERCMTIKVGQDVTFTGDFVTHPLTASGGDVPNPFSNADQSTASSKITFAKAGTFGFMCGVHPAMTGAIRVIE